MTCKHSRTAAPRGVGPRAPGARAERPAPPRLTPPRGSQRVPLAYAIDRQPTGPRGGEPGAGYPGASKTPTLNSVCSCFWRGRYPLNAKNRSRARDPTGAPLPSTNSPSPGPPCLQLSPILPSLCSDTTSVTLPLTSPRDLHRQPALECLRELTYLLFGVPRAQTPGHAAHAPPPSGLTVVTIHLKTFFRHCPSLTLASRTQSGGKLPKGTLLFMPEGPAHPSGGHLLHSAAHRRVRSSPWSILLAPMCAHFHNRALWAHATRHQRPPPSSTRKPGIRETTEGRVADRDPH